ncbi:MAG TPA: hypothetical protein VGM33_15125 [Baekduia sp.]|jgi:hypothetical protein
MRATPAALAAALILMPAAAARASAPGWSTPHTADGVAVGIYGAGPNGQGVQLFGASGAAQTRTAQIRAINSDATQGTAVGVNAAGKPGFDDPAIAVNPGGALVAAWTLDTLQPGPIGLAAALGTRTALPRTATVLPTQGITAAVATAIAPNGTATVAWIEAGTPNAVKAATLRPGQAPQVAVLATTTTAVPANLSLGLDGAGRPIATWTTTTSAGTAIDIARGDGTGAFAPAVEQPLTTAPVVSAQTFVLSTGALVAVWSEGVLPDPLTLRTANAPAGGAAPFGPPRLLATAGSAPQPSVAASATGRIAVFYAVGSGSGVSLRTLLRTTSGTWGTPHAAGPSGARTVSRINAGVDAKGRVVILWDDAAASAHSPTRILAARAGSSTSPPGTYHQLPQRSGDGRCDEPTLTLSTSGDGLGSWLCAGTGASAGQSGRPRLARLTKPS